MFLSTTIASVDHDADHQYEGRMVTAVEA